jgi:hypothetical protein
VENLPLNYNLQFGHHACVKTITHFSATWK